MHWEIQLSGPQVPLSISIVFTSCPIRNPHVVVLSPLPLSLPCHFPFIFPLTALLGLSPPPCYCYLLRLHILGSVSPKVRAGHFIPNAALCFQTDSSYLQARLALAGAFSQYRHWLKGVWSAFWVLPFASSHQTPERKYTSPPPPPRACGIVCCCLASQRGIS